MRHLPRATVPTLSLVCLLMATVPPSRADTVPGGDVGGTWTTSGSPYLVTGEITVPLGQTLTIESGVEVRLQGHHKIVVRGRLLAIGAPGDTIRFRAESPATGWSGLRFVDTATNAQPRSELAYCRIEHGRVYGTCPDNSGGAIYLGHALATVAHCLLTNNASVSGSGSWGGGAVYLEYSSEVTIRDCVITGNSTGHDGGGIYVYWGTPDITGNLITNNSAGRGGGIACFQYGAADVAGNDISANQGEGLYLSGSAARVVNNRIAGNTANGIRSYLCSPAIIGNLVTGNGGTRGAGVCNEGASPQLSNNTIIGNTATGEGGGVGSFQVVAGATFPSNPTLTNDIIRGNSATTGAQVAVGTGCGSTVRYCDVQDLARGGISGAVTLGSGNLDEPASFAGSGQHPYALTGGSPCRDAGMPGTADLPARDLAGRERVIGVDVDQGAYEYDPLTAAPGVASDVRNLRLEAHPNPFNPATSLTFAMPVSGHVTMVIHDLRGAVVRVLIDGELSAGPQELRWDGTDGRGRTVAAGRYICRLEACGIPETQLLTLVR